MSIAENLAAVENRIRAACQASGRPRDEVRLLAVSKMHTIDLLEEAYAAGVRDFGESRVQEASEKAEHFADRDDVRWTFIGHLQSNKAKQAVAFAHEVQTVDSVKIATALDRHAHEAGRPLDVYLEVNTSGEATKSGFQVDEVMDAAASIAGMDALRIKGLMTIATNTDDEARVRRCFRDLVELRDRLRDAHGGGFDELSMGMSGDMEWAIEEGSTCVRVGTAIFGARAYPTAS